MAGKFYAVRKGRKNGIYFTWADCQAQINGFSGAEYKSFKTKEEAEAYIMGGQANQMEVTVSDDEKAVAYVDGSYNIRTKEYSYGAILIYM